MDILTGKHHFKGFDLMRQLLENEGIKIDDDKVIDFEDKTLDSSIIN